MARQRRSRDTKQPSGHVELGHQTDLGRKREGNEDAYVALLPPNTPPGVEAVLAVADGMGGHQAGEVASALAVGMVTKRVGPGSNDLSPNATASEYRSVLQETVTQANKEIISQSQGERSGMGTTLTVGLIEKSRVHIGHVGDSRAYLFRGGVLQAITNDHSWVAEEVRAGRLTPEEATTHPRRNLLTQALGADSVVDVETNTLDLEPGDLLLFCSDGLHGVVSDEEIAAVLRDAKDLQVATNTLIDLANANGGPDNITVLVARIDPQGGAGTDDGGGVSEAKTVASGKTSARSRRWWGLLAFIVIVLAVLGGVGAAWLYGLLSFLPEPPFSL